MKREKDISCGSLKKIYAFTSVAACVFENGMAAVMEWVGIRLKSLRYLPERGFVFTFHLSLHPANDEIHLINVR